MTRPYINSALANFTRRAFVEASTAYNTATTYETELGIVTDAERDELRAIRNRLAELADTFDTRTQEANNAAYATRSQL